MKQNPRFDPWTEAARSYDFLLKNPRLLALAAAPWALFSIACMAALQLWLRYDYDLLGSWYLDNWEDYRAGVGVLLFFVLWSAAAGMANTWHRVVLLNETPSIRFGPPSRRFGRYFRWCLVLGVGVYAVHLAVIHVIDFDRIESDAVFWLALWAPLFPVAMIMARFSLLLPAVAVDEERMTLGSSWAATAGSSGRFFVGLCAVTLPVCLIAAHVGTVQYFVPAETLGVVGLMTSVALIGLVLILGALASTYLSFMYQHFVEAPSERVV